MQELDTTDFSGPPLSPRVCMLVSRGKIDQAAKVYQQETGASPDIAAAAIAWARGAPRDVLYRNSAVAKKSRSHSSAKIAGITIAAVILLVVVLAIGAGNQRTVASSGPPPQAQPTPTPAPPAPTYSVAINGDLPSVESVGVPVSLSITATNNGDHISHLVLWFDGLDSWVIDDVRGCNGAATSVESGGNSYDFGDFPAGATCAITLDLTPKTSGNPTLSVMTYRNITSDGYVDTNTTVQNSSSAGQWTPAINP